MCVLNGFTPGSVIAGLNLVYEPGLTDSLLLILTSVQALLCMIPLVLSGRFVALGSCLFRLYLCYDKNYL